MAKILKDTYVIKIILTKFFGASIQQVPNEEGVLEECVCIPIDRNNLKKNKKQQVTSYFFMSRRLVPDIYGWTHYLRMKCEPRFMKKMKDMGYEMPYFGNAKDKVEVIYKQDYQRKLVMNAEDDE